MSAMLAEVKQEERLSSIEHELVEIRGDIKLVKWMMGVLITMNIGIFIMLMKIISK